MNKETALLRMVPPGAHKRGKWREGVIQIWCTRACDKACFGCTQGSNLKANPQYGYGYITPENFEKACISLKNYHGVVGVFGGNPAMHPEFDTLCEILCQNIPYHRRGLWCNNPLGHGKLMSQVFDPSISNLNVHLDQKAYDEFKRDWPLCNPVGLHEDSRHSPVHGSPIDLGVPESERWERISNCDINKHWSGMFGQFRGELRFWFCEIAGAQGILNQHKPDYPDTGFVIEDKTGRQPWQWSMQDYANQVNFHCHRCLVPYRGYGELAQSKSGHEVTTESYLDIFKPKKADRDVQIVSSPQELHVGGVHNVVSYIENSRL